jgi:NTE family protein
MPAKLRKKSTTISGPTFALALGGGGARGLAHIHVIEAFDELGMRPTAISGSSIGAIMGSAMAAGMSGKDIREHAISVLSDRTQVMNRLWQLRPKTLTGVLKGAFRLTQFDVERILVAFMPRQVPASFEELQIPLQVTATDFYGQSEVVFSSGDLFNAVAASAAIPALFRPVLRDGRILIDGGIYNPVPFDLLDGKADFVVAIDVVGGPEGDAGRMPGSIDAMFGASQLMMQSIVAMKLKAHQPAIFLRPQVNRFRVMDFLKVNTVLRETIGLKDDVKRAMEAAIVFSEKRAAG